MTRAVVEPAAEPSTPVEEPWVRVLGVRHHGPGSARAVAAALERLQPDTVLIEGPADADPLVGLVAGVGMQPPVALLAYAVGEPSVSAFWPFAVFSPEWQALTWAVRHEVPVRFCDLPAAVSLAGRPESDVALDREVVTEPGVDAGDAQETAVARLRTDPIALLAEAAGYDDPERWWDDVVELRGDGADPFEAISEAMATLRATAPTGPDVQEARREAHMRQVLRAARKAGARRVVVVCGAWHAPALDAALPPAAADARLLKGLPKRKVALTWVPWTQSRLAFAAGYGAGVASPGWYHHLFTQPQRPVIWWMTKVAGALRRHDLPASSASVIEAVRLAETLAAMRGRPLAGLAEVTEATRAVLCEGDDAALALVSGELVVGEALGSVPLETPAVPLAADLRAQARRLRLKQEPLEKSLDLDLRTDAGLARSVLLHRLLLLDVRWGVPGRGDVRSTGTFRETWKLTWKPELEVFVIEASMWGTTIGTAAEARVAAVAQSADQPPPLPRLTELVGSCLLADLPRALDRLLSALGHRAARDADIRHLMEALPPLVEALRYGDVRGTDTGALANVADVLLVRICAGLPAAVSGLDDDGASALRGQVESVHAAVGLRQQQEGQERWADALAGLVDRTDVHPLLVGRVIRLLRDAARMAPEDAARRLSRALSLGSTAGAKAAWVEGFLAGGGLLLVHDADLLALLDRWVSELTEDDFVDVLPMVRRTFGGFDVGERRAIGDAVRRGPASRTASLDPVGPDLDEERALPAVVAVARLLGVEVTHR